MAAHPIKNRSHYRSLIKAGELIKLMQDDVLNTDEGHKPMPPQRVNAIKVLLNKVLPDLKAIELSGDADNPIATSLAVHFISDLSEIQNTDFGKPVKNIEQLNQNIIDSTVLDSPQLDLFNKEEKK